MNSSSNCLFLALIALSSMALGASFDCRKKSTALERVICDHAELNHADDYLGSLYKSHLWGLTGNAASEFKSRHRNWLKQRTATCKVSDVACIIQVYDEYNQELSKSVPVIWKRTSPNGYTWIASRKISNSLPPVELRVAGTVNKKEFADIQMKYFNRIGSAVPENGLSKDKTYFKFAISSITVFLRNKPIFEFKPQQRSDAENGEDIDGGILLSTSHSAPLQFGDFNFDGELDFSFAKDSIGTVNATSNFAIFDRIAMTYNIDDKLGKIVSARFHPESKLVTSFWRSSCCHYGKEYYRYTESGLQHFFKKEFKCEETCEYIASKLDAGRVTAVKKIKDLHEGFAWDKEPTTF